MTLVHPPPRPLRATRAGLTQQELAAPGSKPEQLPGGPAAYPVHDDPSVSPLTSEDKPAMQVDGGQEMGDAASQSALGGGRK